MALLNNSFMLSSLGNLSLENFLLNYWQKKHCFIENGLNELPHLPAEELAGYALENDVESRLIIETPNKQNPLKSHWQLQHGPLEADTFSKLPKSHWTLLVQAVDHLHAEINELKHRFSFIPNWRIDDIMVSYASDQGSAGPHFDYYDVFLIQLSGIREWRIGQQCDSQSRLRSDCENKLLTEFNTACTYKASPGDILYIPPGLAHWGIAVGECMTLSVGFRAPSYTDIILDLSQELASKWEANKRYQDNPAELVRNNPGEIKTTDIAEIQRMLRDLAQDTDTLTRWFGCYMTQIQRDGPAFVNETEQWHLSPKARLAYRQNTEAPDSSTLFANGSALDCSTQLAQALCSHHQPTLSEALSKVNDPRDSALMDELINLEILIEQANNAHCD